MKIVLGSDHGGSKYLSEIDEFLQKLNIETIVPCGFPTDSIDYPDVVKSCVSSFGQNEANFIILICGSGVGVSIAANRYSHIRALVTADLYQAKLAREHNHANCLCFGERLYGIDQIKEVIKVFINTSGSKEPRHLNRVEKLGDL
ncbi:MAG: RpiB/LacA/LacB family sugar-phosphate isomerase [Candidatus Cloacimonetes bacterium]|nr:RpiB/LacA/LacB family sugar-phosphate isomerase [Candidatus Cloacimonadota bacterium]